MIAAASWVPGASTTLLEPPADRCCIGRRVQWSEPVLVLSRIRKPQAAWTALTLNSELSATVSISLLTPLLGPNRLGADPVRPSQSDLHIVIDELLQLGDLAPIPDHEPEAAMQSCAPYQFIGFLPAKKIVFSKSSCISIVEDCLQQQCPGAEMRNLIVIGLRVVPQFVSRAKADLKGQCSVTTLEQSNI